MNEGEILAAVLGVYLGVDALFWCKGRPTLTKWVIENSRARKSFAWAVLVFIVWLFLHWEVPCILFGTFCGLPL